MVCTILVLTMAAGTMLAGCPDIYFDRRETVALGACDHIAADEAAQVIDPWPPGQRQARHRIQRPDDAVGG
jgi:hypothetical protein